MAVSLDPRAASLVAGMTSPSEVAADDIDLLVTKGDGHGDSDQAQARLSGCLNASASSPPALDVRSRVDRLWANRRPILIAAVALFAMWMLRYDMQTVGSGAGAYVLDRWTGTFYLLARQRRYVINDE
jgi:hypothetical protein